MSTCDVKKAVEYREIKGFPGYRVGSDGSVWTNRSLGPGRPSPGWRRLKEGRRSNGYVHVSLAQQGVKRRTPGDRVCRTIHRLVLEAFVGPCPSNMCAAHFNGVRDDNRLSNLSWKTQADNLADRRRHGTELLGERNGSAKLSASEVRKLRKRRDRGTTIPCLAREFGVSTGHVWAIIHRRVWSHV